VPRPQRRSASHNVQALTMLARDAGKAAPLPDGIPLNADAIAYYRLLWGMRAPSDWKPAELALIARVANLEVELRREEQRLSTEGHVVGGRLNPRVRAVEVLGRRHVRYLLLLRLPATPTEARAIANRAAQFRGLGHGPAFDDRGLLARPPAFDPLT